MMFKLRKHPQLETISIIVNLNYYQQQYENCPSVKARHTFYISICKKIESPFHFA